jgi:acetolactate synthase-1/2/3 large subunit
MFMKELPTAAQHHAPVTFVVLDNRSLGWVRRGQKMRGDRFIATEFEVQPDFVRIAEASGCHGERVEKPEEIKPALERALKRTRDGIPAVVHVTVDGWEFAPGFERFYARLSG